jgi:hypothetical protein
MKNAKISKMQCNSAENLNGQTNHLTNLLAYIKSMSIHVKSSFKTNNSNKFFVMLHITELISQDN